MSKELEKLLEDIEKTPVRKERQDGVEYSVHPMRRDIRYALFRFRNTGDRLIPGLVEHIEKQFKSGWDWDNFSHIWDLSPVNPLKPIPEREWLIAGGAAVDPRDDELVTAARFHPNAFTRQAR